MNTAISLSEEELELIETRRLEKAKEEREACEHEAWEMHRQIDATKREKKVIELLENALIDADTDNVLDADIDFTIGDEKYSVDIEEHRVSGGSYSWRTVSKGYKYKLCGKFNEWKQQYYIKPETVIKRIVEYQEIAEAVSQRKSARDIEKADALAYLTILYPKFNVEFKRGFDSRNGRYNSNGSYKPDTISVESPNGTYELTFHSAKNEAGESVIEFGTWKYTIAADMRDKVAELILGRSWK
tara:strand:+ start:329 stop:1057 length:729 start_codon:yes stop_codon:yes gene_type:complete